MVRTVLIQKPFQQEGMLVVVPIGKNDREFSIIRVRFWSQRVYHEGRAKAVHILTIVMPVDPVGA